VKDFDSKLVLVTGAASGIGRATAMRFSGQRADLILVDINEEGLESTAGEIDARGGRAAWYRTDPREVDQVEEAGLEDWRWIIEPNLWSCIYTVHFFLPDMMQRRSGHVINVASGVGLFAVPYQAPYNTSKHAVVGLTESIRQEMERYGIGASVVCPGMIRTPIINTVRSIGFGDSVKKMAHRLASPPEKMADAIIRGVKKNRAVIMYPLYINLLYGLKRFSPRAADKLSKTVARDFYRARRSRQRRQT